MLPPEAKYIDDLMHGDLLYWRSVWFGWFLLSTKLVVVGLLMEAFEVIHDIRAMRSRIRIDSSGASIRESHTSDLVKVAALAGWLFIIVGVFGEWYSDTMVSEADRDLQTFADINLAEAQREAGDTATSASLANFFANESERSSANALTLASQATEKVGSVKGIADAARADAKDALAKAKAAQGELARAESDAKGAQTTAANALALVQTAGSQAEKVKQEVARLEKEMAWRDLTAQQQFEIVASLQSFGPKKYDLIIWGNTPEVTRLADKILRTLGQAWVLDSWGFPMGGSASGVLVSTEKGAPADVAAAADALINALNAKGIFAAKAPQYDHGALPAAMMGPWKGQAPIRVVVGFKP